MTLEEIKAMLPCFMKWKKDIAFIYGALYAEKYCTWNRFNDHIEVLREINDEENEVTDLFPESLRDEIRKKEGFNLYENKSYYQET
jgi:hypothetical protein